MGIEVTALDIEAVKLVHPKVFGDARGYFSETYNRAEYSAVGIDTDFCQDNQSLSATRGTLRGLHYQAPPFGQSKLVRVVRGAILDVAVDVRSGSPTYGEWVSAELSAENHMQIFIPAGFLHGFVTLVPNTEVAYKVDAFYDKASDGAVRWNDPDLAIDWGLGEMLPVVSEKDESAPFFKDFTTPF